MPWRLEPLPGCPDRGWLNPSYGGALIAARANQALGSRPSPSWGSVFLEKRERKRAFRLLGCLEVEREAATTGLGFVPSAKMAFDFGRGKVSWDAACEDKISDGVELCPFLRNIGVTTSFAFSNMKFPVPAPVARGPGHGPIFEDGPGFESSFRLFHGKDGVVPLARTSQGEQRTAQPVADAQRAQRRRVISRGGEGETAVLEARLRVERMYPLLNNLAVQEDDVGEDALEPFLGSGDGAASWVDIEEEPKTMNTDEILEGGGGSVFWSTLQVPTDAIIVTLDRFQSITGVPWWLTIIRSTAALRVALFPLTVAQLQKASLLARLGSQLPPPVPPPATLRPAAVAAPPWTEI